MQPLLESFESFFYVLVNTLPVGIGIGLLFFGIGFLFTNPRIKRLQQQITNYKEEVQRMSRRQAQVTTQHQELLENLQAVENENLALQSSLETKNDELIDLLDRLNNIAGDAETANAVGDSESVGTENAKLRKRIAELTGRLRTSESSLQDRKVELARARNELARVGVPQEATTTGGGSSGGNQGWRPDSSTLEEDDDLSGTDDSAELQDTVDALAEQPTDLVDQETGVDISGSEPAPSPSSEDLDATAAGILSGATGEPGAPVASGDKDQSPATAPEQSPAGAPLESIGESPTREEQTTDLEDQLAEFEERLRAREAEFFALQEQLSFGTLDSSSTAPAPAPAPVSSLEADSPRAAAGPAGSEAAIASEQPGETSAPKPAEEDSETQSPFPPLTGKKAPVPPLHTAVVTEAPSPPLAPGEQLIFRGSDPSLWGQQSGSGLVRPSEAPKNTKFLRLRRCDTGKSVIIRVSKKHLSSPGPPESVFGWNGKADAHAGIVHLGIYDHSLPQEVETRFGAGGWGFGHHTGNREGQAYCWAGMSIPRTDFEISTLSKLPDAQALKETGASYLDSPSIAPSTDEELVFFHSSHPEIWNKNAVDGKGGFALNLSRIPAKTRFLQVSRSDNGNAVIIPVSRDKITLKTGGENQLGWNGANEFFSAGHHLGICDPAATKEVEIAHGCGGYGFGHLLGSSPDRQAVCWAGKAINRIPLEFTAIARELTPEEKHRLLGS